MANYSKFNLLLLIFLSIILISSCKDKSKKKLANDLKLKSMSLTIFQQAAPYNNPANNMMIIQGPSVKIPESSSELDVTLKEAENNIVLGTIAMSTAAQLTEQPNPKSKVLGSMSGMSITSTVPGLNGISMCTVALNMKAGDSKLNGTLSLYGSVNSAGAYNFPTSNYLDASLAAKKKGEKTANESATGTATPATSTTPATFTPIITAAIPMSLGDGTGDFAQAMGTVTATRVSNSVTKLDMVLVVPESSEEDD